MQITILGMKGGIAKTMTAIHLAAYLQQRAPTLLVDGDQNKSVIEWAARGPGAPFAVADPKHAGKLARQFEHVVIDTAAAPSKTELQDLARADLIIVPTSADAMALGGLLKTVAALRELKAERFKILLTLLPPPRSIDPFRPSQDAEDAREILTANKLPLFDGGIQKRSVYQKAALQGVTVDKVRDRRAAEAWAEYEAIGKQILR